MAHQPEAPALVVGNVIGGGAALRRMTLDEVAFYPYSLSATQVANHFAALWDHGPQRTPDGISATAGTNSATVSWTASTAGDGSRPARVEQSLATRCRRM